MPRTRYFPVQTSALQHVLHADDDELPPDLPEGVDFQAIAAVNAMHLVRVIARGGHGIVFLARRAGAVVLVHFVVRFGIWTIENWFTGQRQWWYKDPDVPTPVDSPPVPTPPPKVNPPPLPPFVPNNPDAPVPPPPPKVNPPPLPPFVPSSEPPPSLPPMTVDDSSTELPYWSEWLMYNTVPGVWSHILSGNSYDWWKHQFGWLAPGGDRDEL